MLLGLLAAAVAAVLLTEAAIRRTLWGIGSVVALATLEAAGVVPQVEVAGFRIEPHDGVAGLLGTAAVARLLRSRRLGGAQLLLLVWLGLIVLSVAEGMGVHGIGASVNESRKFLRFGAVALYVSTIVPTDALRDRIGLVWIRFGSALLVIAVLLWLGFFAGIALPLVGAPEDLRVIDSFRTLVVLQAFVLVAGGLSQARLGRAAAPSTLGDDTWRRLTWFAPAAFLAVVLLQHRTLWAALLLGVVLLVWRDPRVGRQLLVRVAGGAALLGIVAFLALGQGQETIVLDRLQGSATDVETFGWRVAGWQELIEDQAPGSFQEVVLGQPMGGGFARFLNGIVVDVSPHNFYLETFLRLGVVGVIVLVGLHLWVVGRLLRSRGGTALVRDDVLAITLVLALLYYLTSHADPEQAILLGLGIAAARARVAPGREPGSPVGRGEVAGPPEHEQHRRVDAPVAAEGRVRSHPGGA